MGGKGLNILREQSRAAFPMDGWGCFPTGFSTPRLQARAGRLQQPDHGAQRDRQIVALVTQLVADFVEGFVEQERFQQEPAIRGICGKEGSAARDGKVARENEERIANFSDPE